MSKKLPCCGDLVFFVNEYDVKLKNTSTLAKITISKMDLQNS